MVPGLVSDVMISNLFTMSISGKYDPRQLFKGSYIIPSQEIRELRARLILEEALETINALGFDVLVEEQGNYGTMPVDMKEVSFGSTNQPHLEDIIDGCCDLEYVTKGTLVACGVPDIPHLQEVCRANNAKFPKGQAIVNENGKFQKPKGWIPPLHSKARLRVESVQKANKNLTLEEIAKRVVENQMFTQGDGE